MKYVIKPILPSKLLDALVMPVGVQKQFVAPMSAAARALERKLRTVTGKPKVKSRKKLPAKSYTKSVRKSAAGSKKAVARKNTLAHTYANAVSAALGDRLLQARAAGSSAKKFIKTSVISRITASYAAYKALGEPTPAPRRTPAKTAKQAQVSKTKVTSKTAAKKTVAKRKNQPVVGLFAKIFGSFLTIICLFASLAAPAVQAHLTLRSSAPAMQQLADNSTMTRQARLHFFAADPKRVAPDQYSTFCGEETAADLSYGCYLPDNNQIYLRDMPKEFDSEETVAAAHEMLHVAYYNLSEAERIRIDGLTTAYYTKEASPELKERMTAYDLKQPGVLEEELHAILATEVAAVPAALETYYAQYFTDRSTIVAAHMRVAEVFTARMNRLNTLDKAIVAKEKQVDEYYQLHTKYAAAGDAANAEAYWYKYETVFYQFHEETMLYNDLVAEYNHLRDAINGQALDPVAGAVQ